MRVVIAEDLTLLREGLSRLLDDRGWEIVAAVDDGPKLVAAIAEHRPDIAIVDVRMPPTHTEEGLEAAREIRARHPQTAIVILSQHVEVGIAMRVLVESPQRLGYLLKDRVTDVEDFASTLRHVAAGGSALDPQIVSELLSGGRSDGPLAALTPREREVLELIAEGRSNKGIGERLEVSTGVVQKHVGSLFAKLGIPDSDDDHRRILAVLTFLRSLGATRLP
jgi:DNA-binding NarL/FixJ family response regulator